MKKSRPSYVVSSIVDGEEQPIVVLAVLACVSPSKRTAKRSA